MGTLNSYSSYAELASLDSNAATETDRLKQHSDTVSLTDRMISVVTCIAAGMSLYTSATRHAEKQNGAQARTHARTPTGFRDFK